MKKRKRILRLEVCKAVKIQTAVGWVITYCTLLSGYQCFEKPCLYSDDVGSRFFRNVFKMQKTIISIFLFLQVYQWFRWEEQVKLFIVLFSSVSSRIFPLSFRYSPQHNVLKHPQCILFPRLSDKVPHSYITQVQFYFHLFCFNLSR